MSAPAGPYIVSRRQSCEDCHGTGERHPTTRGYMAHEIRDCETCERRDDVVSSRWAYATLEEATRHAGSIVGDLARAGLIEKIERIVGFTKGNPGTIWFPDGSAVVVEATNYNRLWDELTPEHEPPLLVGVDLTIWIDGTVADERWGAAILAAWNAEYGIGEGA